MRRWWGAGSVLHVACSARKLLCHDDSWVQNESGWALPTGQYPFSTSLRTSSAGLPMGQPDDACAIRSAGCSNDPQQIPRTQPSHEPSDFAGVRAHPGYVCDQGSRQPAALRLAPRGRFRSGPRPPVWLTTMVGGCSSAGSCALCGTPVTRPAAGSPQSTSCGSKRHRWWMRLPRGGYHCHLVALA